MIDVSIIIPTYNRLWSLPKAIDSCRETRLNVEIIVVDDGSTDGTGEWLDQQTGLIKITQTNQGKDWAVNKGFAIAKGKYIRFLDSDDWLLPFSCDYLFDEAEAKNLDITCAGYQLFDEHENCIRQIDWIICDDFLAQQLGECGSSHYSAYLFRKDFINDIPHRQEYGALDDRQFIIEAAMKLPVTGYINTLTFAHRTHKQQRLQNIHGLQEQVNHLARLNIYKKSFELLNEEKKLTQRYKNAACNNLWHLAHWIAKANIHEAEKVYNWVYKLNPEFIPSENLPVARLYKYCGFVNTERLLRLKRMF